MPCYAYLVALGFEKHVPTITCSIICRHADHACIKPDLVIDMLTKRQSTMAGDDAIGSGQVKFAPFIFRWSRGKDEAVDLLDSFVDHEKGAAIKFESDAAG